MTDLLKLGKKVFTVSVVVLTIVWSMGLAALVPTVVNAVDCPTLEAGDLFQVQGNTAVYLLNADMERMYFPNSEVYHTWYTDFSGVQTIPSACVDAYPAPSKAPYGVNYRPGSRMVKVQISNSVYVVEPGNTKAKVASEDVAKALYGDKWNTMVRDVADVYWPNYVNNGSDLTTATLTNGMLVKKAGSTDVYSVVAGKLYKVDGTLSAAASGDVRTVSDALFNASEMGTGTKTAASVLENPSQTTASGTGTGTVTTGDLMVTLSADSPAASVLPAGSEADLLKVNLKAGATAQKVTALTIQRSNLMVSTGLTDVGVYVDGTRYGNTKSSWNTDKQMTFTFATPITVAANSTVTVTVRGKVANTSTYVGVLVPAASSVVTTAKVSGSFPVSGAVMTVATGVTAGSLTLDNIQDHSGTVNFGDSDVSLAEFDLNNTSSEEDVLLNGITFENGGTAPSTAVNNLRLYVDGDEVGKAEMDGNRVAFSFDGYKIEKSKDVTVELKGDMVNGEENDNLKFFVYDIMATGKDSGLRAAASFGDLDKKSDGAVSTITLSAGDVTLNFNKTTASGTPARDIRPNTKDVVLATLEMTSNDEDVVLNSASSTDTHQFRIKGTNIDSNDLENVRLEEVGGGSYDLSAAWNAGDSAYNLNLVDEIYLTKGVKKTFKLVADVTTNAEEGDKYYAYLDAGAFDYEGQTSGSTTGLTFTPTTLSSAQVTVKQASLTITNTSLSSESLVGGESNVLVYQGKMKAGTSSDLYIKEVKVSTFDAGVANHEGNLFADTYVSQLRLYINGELVKTRTGAIAEGATTSTITFSGLNTLIPAGKEYTVQVKADFASTLDAGEYALTIVSKDDVTARDQDSESLTASQINTVTPVEGKVITYASAGTLKVDMQTDSSNWNRDLYVLAGSTGPTGRYLGELVFTGTNEDITVTSLTLSATSTATATNSDVDKVQLVDGSGNVVAEANYDTNTEFTDLSYLVKKDSSQSLYVRVKAKGMNVEGDDSSTATSGSTVILGISAVEASGATSGTITMTAGGATPAADKFDTANATKEGKILGATLTNVTNQLADGVLTGGSNRVIAKYALTFDNGSNRKADDTTLMAVLSSLKLTLTTSSAVTLSNVQAYLDGDSSVKTAAVNNVGSGAVTLDFTSGDFATGNANEVDGVVTIVVTGTVGTSAADGEYLQTEINSLATDLTWTDGTTSVSDSRLKISSVTGANFKE